MQAAITNAVTLVGAFALYQTDHMAAAVVLTIVGGLLGIHYEDQGK